MAGVVPSRSGTTRRKQWTLHSGPHGSLKRLRNQLANDGCSESQVVLAKQLFEEECELEVDKKENARLGVYWLIRASEQGNKEATELLRNCLITGRGITEQNYMDVKSCINMSQDEKIARKAAREMFASLSNGEDFITSDQLQKRMLEIQSQYYNKISTNKTNQLEDGDLVNNVVDSDSDSNEETDWSTRNDEKTEKLTEDHLVNAAANYSHGQLPIVNRVLNLTDANINALNHIPLLQQPIRHPFLAIKLIYYKLIRLLSDRLFSSYISFNRTDFQILLLIIYSLFNAESISLFIPTVLFYGSFVTMVITTFKMLQCSRDFQDFQIWSGLFLTYSGGNLNHEEAEYQFIRNNLKPYGHFFLALLVNLVIYPLIVIKQWIPQSEITVIAFSLTFITLLTFMFKERSRKFPDFLVLFSFAINVLAKYPYEIDPVVTQTWRFLDLKIPNFASYVIGNGIEFCLNFRLLFYVFIPVIFIYIAARQHWRGTYKFFIPHCVTLSWLQIVVINSQGATMFGLLRGTLALVGIVLFLPLFGLTTILLPAVAIVKWLVINDVLYSFLTFLIIAGVSFLVTWLLSHSRFNKLVSLLQVIFALIAGYILLNSIIDNNNKNTNLYPKLIDKKITWEQYHTICNQPAWDKSNIARAQINCHKLVDTPVHWNGYVNDIKLRSINNNWKYYIDKLPSIVNDYLYCYYGELIEDACQHVNEFYKDDCIIINNIIKANKKCTLEKWNYYEYEISIRMQSGIWGKTSEILVIAENDFTNFTMQLKPNDKIWFTGKLINNLDVGSDGYLGGIKPYVYLNEIGCLACHNLNLTNFRLNTNVDNTNVQNMFTILMTGVKFVLNILFNPIVIIK